MFYNDNRRNQNQYPDDYEYEWSAFYTEEYWTVEDARGGKSGVGLFGKVLKAIALVFVLMILLGSL